MRCLRVQLRERRGGEKGVWEGNEDGKVRAEALCEPQKVRESGDRNERRLGDVGSESLRPASNGSLSQ